MNNLDMAAALLFEPRKAFAEIDARPRYWVPLLVLILATVVACGLVPLGRGSRVGHRSCSSVPVVRGNLTEAQIEGRSAAAARPGPPPRWAPSPPYWAWSSQSCSVLSVLLPVLAGKVTNVQRSFKQWFALACWTSLPGADLIPAARSCC